jgi:hypothetical protein
VTPPRSQAELDYLDELRRPQDAWSDLDGLGTVVTPERLVEVWSHNALVDRVLDAASDVRKSARREVERVLYQGTRVAHAKLLGLRVGSEEESSAWERTTVWRARVRKLGR